MKSQPNPMEKALEALKTAPKCLAHARTTGEPCKNASMKNGRCRMHGGKSTGRPIVNGQRCKNAIEDRKIIKCIITKMRSFN
jgi:hypothetical protein